MTEKNDKVPTLVQAMESALVIGGVLMRIHRYGGIDGAHHKQWLLDQIVRDLTGSNYDEWVKAYEQDGEYEWDTGVAP